MFDSHAHVADGRFDDDRLAVTQRAREAGLTGWLEIASTVLGSKEAIALAEQTEGVLASIGVHPEEIGTIQEKDWQILDNLASKEKVAAIGEVGLDFHRDGNYEKQIIIVEKFVALAVKHKKPIVWHLRSGQGLDANDLLLDYLGSLSADIRPRGVAHTFSGTVEQAARCVELGLNIGISGIVTFKNAGRLLDVVRTIELKHLLIETDCPYLAPEPCRGQRNEPAYVRFIAEKIAQLKEMDGEEIALTTERNFWKMIGREEV